MIAQVAIAAAALVGLGSLTWWMRGESKEPSLPGAPGAPVDMTGSTINRAGELLQKAKRVFGVSKVSKTPAPLPKRTKKTIEEGIACVQPIWMDGVPAYPIIMETKRGIGTNVSWGMYSICVTEIGYQKWSFEILNVLGDAMDQDWLRDRYERFKEDVLDELDSTRTIAYIGLAFMGIPAAEIVEKLRDHDLDHPQADRLFSDRANTPEIAAWWAYLVRNALYYNPGDRQSEGIPLIVEKY